VFALHRTLLLVAVCVIATPVPGSFPHLVRDFKSTAFSSEAG